MNPPGRLVGHFRLLAAHLSVHVDDQVVAGAVTEVLRQFQVDEPAGRSVVVRRTPEGFIGTLDGGPFFRARDTRECVTYMIWRINELVAETPSEHLLVHASVASTARGALVFPGVSGAGKSTLVAALVRAGFGYLSDELAPIALGSTTVVPYPRSITLEQDAWPWFPELDEPGRVIRAIDQWFVPPDRLRPGCVDLEQRLIAAVIFPRADPGAPTALDEIGRAEALMRLARNAVNLTEHGAAGFQTLAEVVRRVPMCAQMVSGSVEDAVAAVLAEVSPAVEATQRGT